LVKKTIKLIKLLLFNLADCDLSLWVHVRLILSFRLTGTLIDLRRQTVLDTFQATYEAVQTPPNKLCPQIERTRLSKCPV
jgi:hypothetical protein